MRRTFAVLAVAGVIALAGCAAWEDSGPPSSPVATSRAAAPSPADGCPSTASPEAGVDFDRALHDELMGMLERDQAGRTGTGPDDETWRTSRTASTRAPASRSATAPRSPAPTTERSPERRSSTPKR